MKILITGSSGLVGSALRERLRQDGHDVWALVRRPPAAGHEITWDPETGFLQADSLEGFDAVVHLAGENVAGGRWTRARKRAIEESRVKGTSLLAERLAELARKPKVLVSASAIGYYGDRGEEAANETTARGDGFLAEVCERWERAADPAREAGIRVVHPRIGMVLDDEGGALARMLLPFKLGLGGRLGSGRQWMSWIAIDDLVSAIVFAIEDERLSGPFNAVAPEPVRNVEFTKTLARALHRPAIAPVPAFALRTLVGGLADELLLASARVEPCELEHQGFRFEHATLEEALHSVLAVAA